MNGAHADRNRGSRIGIQRDLRHHVAFREASALS
jgi:hypothetical protein